MTPRILVTVGTQLPFDRLIGAVATWHRCHPKAHVTLQTGATALSASRLSGTEHYSYMDKSRFAAVFAAADLIVAHAGMGTILSAAEAGKHVLVLPRRADLGEHRNDHQLATVRRMEALETVTCARSTMELTARLNAFVADWSKRQDKAQCLGSVAQPQLISAVRDFIFEADRP